MEQATLPPRENKGAVEDAVDSARRAAWFSRNTFLVWCQISYYYLRGYRRFRVNSLSDAKLLVGYENDLGDLNLRNEDIREKYKTAVGRFLRMDLSPVVTKRSWGLDSIRKSSVAQVALDHELRFMDQKCTQSTFIQLMLIYGTVGLGHFTYMDVDGKDQNEIEVIPPWELLPMPSYPSNLQQLQGLQRFRKVPLKWLRKQEGFVLPDSDEEEKLQTEKIPFGSSPASESIDLAGFNQQLSFTNTQARSTAQSDTSQEALEVYVPLLETWMIGPDYTVSRYVAKVGKHVAKDTGDDYRKAGKRVPMPISMARYIPDSGFYSYGLVTMLLSGNHQQEKMLRNLYRNVEELDQYGTVMWPLTAGAGKNEFNKKNGRPKIVGYEPDYTVPDAKPFTISPVNTGDFPGRVAMMAGTFQDKLAGQGPLFQGQSMGRVDSAAGLGFTFEVSQIAQAATAHQIADCWSQVYKSLLYTIKETWQEGKMLTVTNVDDNIAGVRITEDGQVSLDDNPIPDYWEVDLDVKDREPRSIEARKQELMMMLEKGLIDPTEFRIINWNEDLDFPVGNRAEFEAYRKAVYNNIVLFGDGKTPGEINPDIFMDNPEIHLRALTSFVARLEMSFASKEVRTAFTDYIQLLQQMLSQGYPSQLPPMEDLAAEALGKGGGPGSGPGGPGGPGGSGGPSGPSGPASGMSGGPPGGPGGSPMDMMAGLQGI